MIKIIILLIVVAILTGVSIEIGRLDERGRFFKIMVAFLDDYEGALKKEHEEFQRGVYFLADFLRKSMMQDKGDK